MPAKSEVSLDPGLDGGHPDLLEPGDLRLRKALIREVRQRRPAPQAQRRPQPRASFLRISVLELLAAPCGHLLEPVRIELVRRDLERISAPVRGQRPLAEGLAQVRYVDLKGLARGGGPPPRPDGLDETVGRDGLASVEQQDGQHRLLLMTSERERLLVDYLQWPEDPEVKHRPPPLYRKYRRAIPSFFTGLQPRRMSFFTDS